MKFIIPRSDFSKLLLTANRSILSRTNLPILANLLISAKGGEVEVLSTNLETAVRLCAKSKVETEGKITIGAKALVEFVSQLPDEDVSFELLGEEALIAAGGYNARFATMGAFEFPAIPKIEKGLELSVGAGDLVEAITKVAFSAAQDEGRPILTGVLCEINKNRLSMIATDGYRLSFFETKIVKGEKVPNIKVVIPAKALMEFGKIIAEILASDPKAGQEVRLEIAETLNQLCFKIGNIEFTSRLIEGEFPNWQKTIPTAFSSEAKINKDELVKLVKVASIFAREAGNIVRLKLEENAKKPTISVYANASQLGSGSAKMDIELQGPGGEIAFNFRYLLDVLGLMEDDEVVFEMIESLNPGRLRGQAEKDTFFHIIMPVRLQG